MFVESIFPNNDAGKHSLIFMAGFHLGIPLAICQTRKSTGWAQISEELSERFSSTSSLFEVVSINYEPTTNFPLGKPLAIRFLNFLDVLDLQQLLQNAGVSLPANECKLDNLIWVCPSGVVLIMGKMSYDRNNFISLCQFDKVMQDHYAELAYIFTVVAEVIIAAFPNEILSSSLCCAIDVEKCRKGIDFRRGIPDSGMISCSSVARWLQSNGEARALYDDILVDVYYIDSLAREQGEKLRIDYFDTSIESSDPLYLLIIGIAFSSFIGLLWLQKHLGEQSRIVQRGLIGTSPLREGISFELKLLRIFCLRFINESSPISIRLTRAYVMCLEECWKQFRMHTLIDQVNDQLATLENMFDWIDEIYRETRNIKIGLAAVLLALISVAAVAAQLVSTIDVNSQLGVEERILLIFTGFVIGILSTFGIYMLPVSRWRTRLGALRGKRHLGQ